jgi:hypothetical protein
VDAFAIVFALEKAIFAHDALGVARCSAPDMNSARPGDEERAMIGN